MSALINLTAEIQMEKPAVFDWLLQRHVHEYFDVDGRPVGEGRAKAYAQVETKFKSCPYAGSRYHHAHPMNVSALQSILPEWQKSLLLLSWLSQRFQDYYRQPVHTYYDLALISGMGVFLADFVVMRHQQPLQSHYIPVWLSGLYKVCLGFQQATFLAMMNDHFKSAAEDKVLPDAKGFYAYLEASELLIGEAEVCGGSEEMISRAYETMKGGHPVLDALQVLPQLAAMDIDWAGYDSFSYNTSNLWRKAILFIIQMQGYAPVLAGTGLPDNLVGAVNQHLQAGFGKLLKAQSGLAVEIARITLADSGHSLAEWLAVQQVFLDEINFTGQATACADALTAAVLEKISEAIDLSGHEAMVCLALKPQLDDYVTFETAVLGDFNNHLGFIQAGLGYQDAGVALSAADLISVYGKTLRNLPEFLGRI